MKDSVTYLIEESSAPVNADGALDDLVEIVRAVLRDDPPPATDSNDEERE
jgi:hypothetical protein